MGAIAISIGGLGILGMADAPQVCSSCGECGHWTECPIYP